MSAAPAAGDATDLPDESTLLAPVLEAGAAGNDAAAADAVDALVETLYGAPPSDDDGPVFHITAAWRPPDAPDDAPDVVMAIRDATPPSLLDAFVLGAARMRADAIVTTGANLRAEPELTHDPIGPPALIAALRGWRRARRPATPERPYSLVLTSGRGLDFAHPLLRAGDADDAPRIIVYTGLDAARRLGGRDDLDRERVTVIGAAEPSMRGAIDYLQQRRGCDVIAIESGPSSAGPLYDPPMRIDELRLSLCHADALPADLHAGALPSDLLARLPDGPATREDAARARSADGVVWSFQQRRR
ncbi:MAG: hypothetical protein AAF772_19685 [Acidobacteriota bacterium]